MAHEHIVTDTDKHFSIDPATKEIKHETDRIVLIQRSHNSERFTFDIPRYIEGHDMSLCNVVHIHYQNRELASGIEFDDIYEVDDFKVSAEDENLATFSWLISGNATQYVGYLSFSISFECVAEDGALEYCWPTAEYSGVVISKSLYNSETVAAAYSDIMMQWYNDLYLASIGEGVSVEQVRELLGIVAVRAVTVPLPAADWVDNIQTINLAQVTADNIIIATHAPESYTQYIGNDVRLSGQADHKLTFACELTPTSDINVNIVILE